MRKIRDARTEDAERLLEIYTYYVKNTAITFETEVPELTEFQRRMENVRQRYPYLAAEVDGRIVGYAYASPFHPRAAYAWAAESTIYVDKDCRHGGMGRCLYEALEAALCEMGVLNLNACIGSPSDGAADEYLTRNSEKFHAHMGYQLVGRFHKCGYKFGRWYDMIWMEKMLGKHTKAAVPVRNYVPKR